MADYIISTRSEILSLSGVVIDETAFVTDEGNTFIFIGGDAANLSNWLYVAPEVEVTPTEEDKKYIGGTPVAVGMDVQSNRPLDEREIITTLQGLTTLDNCYGGIEVKVSDLNYKKYKWNGLDQANLYNWHLAEPNEDEINDIAAQVAINTINIDANRLAIDVNEGNITDNSDAITINEGNITGNADDITDLQDNKLDDVLAGTNITIDKTNTRNPILNVDDMSYDDTTLAGRVTQNESDISDNSDDISTLSTSKENKTEKGIAGGYAELDGTGKVPSSQIPAGIDEVQEFTNYASLPAVGVDGIIYITLDTNKTWRWGGSTYVEISQGVVLGETSTTAYRGDRGKTAFDHSQDDSKHLLQAQKDALDGASTLSGSNVVASMEDVLEATTIGVEETVTATVQAGDIDPGEQVVQSTSLTEFVKQLIAPVLEALLKTNKSLAGGGISTHSEEVGATFTDTMTYSLNQGLIDSRDAHPDVALIGGSTGATFSGSGINTSTGAISKVIASGAQRWAVIVDHATGTLPYYDSDGVQGHNLDALRVAGSLSAYSSYVTGRYNRWYDVGAVGSTPDTSAGVRVLTNKGWAINSSFNITIPQGDREISIYIPASNTLASVLYVESFNLDVTALFLPTSIDVNDGNGAAVSYKKYKMVIGGEGYDAAATYHVTIN